MAGLMRDHGGGPREGSNRDRAQMLLIGAFVLAVTFVALALVVNSAIYTENLSSRNNDGGADDALEARHAVADGVGDAMAEANVYNNSDWSALTDNVTSAAETVSRITAREYAADGRFLSVAVTNHVEGTRIADEAAGGSTFEGTSGTHNWTVVRTSDTRAFVLTVDHGAVLAGGSNFGGDPTDEFLVNVTDGTNHWILNVTERSGTFVVGVTSPGGAGGTCAVAGSPEEVEIDLTGGTVAGRDCPAMEFAEGVGTPYDVAYNRSDLVTGNYSLVIDRPGYGNGELQPGPDAGAADDPYRDIAAYASTLRFRYDTPNLAYATDVRVAPGEPR